MGKIRNYKSEEVKHLRQSSSIDEMLKIEAKMGLSLRIAEAINQNFSSKGEFAESMGVSRGLVSRWLSGTHNFTVETLVEIESKLGIDLLFKRDHMDKEYLNELHHI